MILKQGKKSIRMSFEGLKKRGNDGDYILT